MKKLIRVSVLALAALTIGGIIFAEWAQSKAGL